MRSLKLLLIAPCLRGIQPPVVAAATLEDCLPAPRSVSSYLDRISVSCSEPFGGKLETREDVEKEESHLISDHAFHSAVGSDLVE